MFLKIRSPCQTMIHVMQFLGGTCYRWEEFPFKPKFSMSLCMWSLFTKITFIFLIFVSKENNFYGFVDATFSNFVMEYCCVILAVADVISPIFLSFHGRQLTALLEGIEELKKFSDIKKIKGISCFHLLCLLVTYTTTPILSACRLITEPEWKDNITAYVVGLVVAFYVFLSGMMVQMLFLELGEEIVHLLEVNVLTFCTNVKKAFSNKDVRLMHQSNEENHNAISPSFKVPQTLKSFEKSTPSIDLHYPSKEVPASVHKTVLDSISRAERQFTEVESLQASLISCFLESVFLLFVSAIVAIISTTFLMANNVIRTGGVISCFLVNIFSLFLFCRLGHKFEALVDTAVMNITEVYECVLVDDQKTMAYRLILRLESMKSFDMGGRFLLRNSTLLTILNAILSYVVILLQIGMMPAFEDSPSANMTGILEALYLPQEANIAFQKDVASTVSLIPLLPDEER
ncbi:uncharacterized protein [Palaemon carinicauda]|uniref:uncharacterized protein n=1 Tax=Palaemon carinicauda TaxID=392227 RepID=UPI0035B64F6E